MAKVIKYTPKSVASEWAEDAKTLAGLDEGQALVIEGDKSARVAFQRAARDEGYTARCVESSEVEEDKFEFTFIRAELRTRTAKPKDGEDAEAEVAEAE